MATTDATRLFCGFYRYLLFGVTIGLFVSSVSGLAFAAETGSDAAAPMPSSNESGALEEIVVTAQKRSESLQKVPISVTAVTGESLQEQHVFDTTQLPTIAPSLQQQAQNNQVGTTNFSIRGIGTTVYGPQIESSVGIVIDDVAMSRPQFGIVQLFDLARIEVLEGPQGMLFGKNASAGLINIVTNKPELGRYDALAHVSFGNTDDGTHGNEYIAQAAANVPVGEDSAVRVSIFGTRNDSLIKNIHDPGEDLGMTEYGGRLKYLWQPNGDWQVYLAADWAHETGAFNSVYTRRFDAPGGYIAQEDAAAGITASPNNFQVASNAPSSNFFDSGGAQANISYTFQDGITATDVAAYRYYGDRSNLDIDQLPVPLFDTDYQGRNYWQVSNEFRVASSSSGRFQWQAGLYYLHLSASNFNRIYGDLVPLNPIPISPPPPPGVYTLGGALDMLFRNDSYAAFGQGTVSIIDSLRLTGGLRYTYDDISYSAITSNDEGPFQTVLGLNPEGAHYAATTRGNVSFRVGAEYDVAPDVLGYITFARGYKGPTFDQVVPGQPVSPEIPIDVELGVKSTLLDQKLELNLALFHEDFHGFQSQARASTTAVNYTVLNAGTLKSEGVEAQFRAAPVHGLSINGGLVFNQATYGSFTGDSCYYAEPTGTTGTNVCLPNGATNSTGNRLAFAPRWTGNASASYRRNVSQNWDAFVQGDYYYRSNFYFTSSEDPKTYVGGAGIVGASLGAQTEDGRWRIALFGRNLADKHLPEYIRPDVLAGLWGDVPRGGDYWNQFDINSFRTIGISLDYKL